MESYCTNKVNSTGYVKIQSGNETALIRSLAHVGPIRYNNYCGLHIITIIINTAIIGMHLYNSQYYIMIIVCQ